MRLRRQVALLLAAALNVAFSVAEPTPAAQANRLAAPIRMTFSAGEAGDESLSRGVYWFRLQCSVDLSCGLQLLALNECVVSKGSPATFTPRADYWSTQADSLVVVPLGENKIELTVYQAFGRKLPAKITLTFAPEQPPLSRLADFKTSGFIDGRRWPDLSAHIEYVPIRHDRTKVLDCPVALPGLTP
jgi:hypothetical protein